MKRRTLVLSMALVLAWGLLLPGGGTAQQKVAKIGMSLPLTGADADSADAIRKGAEMAVEELFFAKNTTTVIAVGQARGIALLVAAEAGLAVSEYKPMHVKQAVHGYGLATKEQVGEMVRVLLGLPSVPRPDDAADAAAVAICHLHTSHLSARL